MKYDYGEVINLYWTQHAWLYVHVAPSFLIAGLFQTPRLLQHPALASYLHTKFRAPPPTLEMDITNRP